MNHKKQPTRYSRIDCNNNNNNNNNGSMGMGEVVPLYWSSPAQVCSSAT